MPAHAQPSADDRVKALLDEDLDATMRRSPTWASQRGDRRFDDRLGDPSPEAEAAWVEQAKDRLARLEAVDVAALSSARRVDARLLGHVLRERIEEARWPTWQLQVGPLGGPQQELPQLPDRLSFDTREQREAFLRRLEAMPGYLAQVSSNLEAGLASGWTPPRVTVGKVADQALVQATDALLADPTAHSLYAPFRALAADDPLAVKARAALAERVLPAFRRFGELLRDRYVPACRTTTAAKDLPDGAAYYQHRLASESTTTLTAEQIHAIGLEEVARIEREMLGVIDRAKFRADGLEGTARIQAFVKRLRSDPAQYHASAEALLAAYRDIAKRVDPELPRLFGVLPRTPYGVREMPAFMAPTSPTAYYYQGSWRNGVPGWFVANTHRLDQRPKYEMVALTLHEAVPGHHLQLALQDEQRGQHEWRSLVHCTAYVEGWALYAEGLGLVMGPPGTRGLYADPVDDFGRLSYAMWRALRLVVDTGLHAFGWPRERAVAYMLEKSALTPENVEREVDRYISWPGQAVAYALGRRAIEALRAKAEAALGDRFDVRAFHDALLAEGAVPLPVLEAVLEEWIAARR
jgi:uncharacterized protein (DUF885 family)